MTPTPWAQAVNPLQAAVEGDVWVRARELRLTGLGSTRIWRTLYREGWSPLPTRYMIENHMTIERWPVAGRQPVTAKELRAAHEANQSLVGAAPDPDTHWRAARKRCPDCMSVSDGEVCPNGHDLRVLTA